MNIETDVFEKIEETWRDRCVTQGRQNWTDEYLTAQAEFFTGAMVAMHALGVENAMTPRWIIPVMAGRVIGD